MRQAVRFQGLLTLILAVAAIVPILMVSLLYLWESRNEATAVRDQANSHAWLIARAALREVEQARKGFEAIIPADSEVDLGQVMADARNQQFFLALYLTDARGNVARYHARNGAIQWVRWPLPDTVGYGARLAPTT